LASGQPAYPNRFARFLLRAMKVEMGEMGLSAVMRIAWGDDQTERIPANTLAKEFSFESLSALNRALDTHYDADAGGARIGRGMALRVGRAWFYQGIKGFGALAGIETPKVAALPSEARARLALEALAHIFTHFSDQTSWLDESDRVFRFIVDPCAPAWGMQSDRPVCQMIVGLLQECVRWASGQDLLVRETNCRAVEGGACIFVINKQPVEPLSADKPNGE
jgi:predicted hydrocarbon binding protein